MLEIELKFRVTDADQLHARLHPIASWHGDHHEVDEYWNAPDRNFKETDEAFRLRTVNDSCTLTYKGPKQPGAVKTRTEIEVALADASGPIRELLLALRFRPVGTVEKKRRVYHVNRDCFTVQICLDDVQALGYFAEIEIVTTPEQAAEAGRVVQELARELGLSERVARSYLGLVLEARGHESHPR